MDVAVIGMSCRFPQADTIEEFWENLKSSRNSVTSTPKERWWMSGQADLMAGYLKCPLDEFDANFFNISPKEATYIDPQHRLFLEVSWESLENAGIPPTSLNGTKTGVYLGIGSDEYFRTQLDATEDTIYKIVGNSISAATGRLSFFLNLLGPSFPIEATCASSAVAIHLACAALRTGECSLALAGGVNVLVDANSTYPSALISPNCRSFDASASGFAPAEGCGVIVLKLLKDALQDNNEILGVIRGSYLNHTGKSHSYGTPRSDSEELVIREALRAANINPLDVSYVEAHAGGTAIGDPIEVKAIARVFGSAHRSAPLILGAFKTNIGHPMAAAGVAGVIKMLLCFKHRLIPPNLHMTQLHPDIDLQGIPALLPTSPVAWASSNSNQLIGAINCFGITGANVHLVMEEPPKSQKSKPAQIETLTILTISAKDEIALENLRTKYKLALDLRSEKNLNLTDFTNSANISRSHLSHRVALVGKTAAEMSQKLDMLNYFSGTVQGTRTPIVFLFTGHGCQYFGMARDLYLTSAIFRAVFDSCSVVYRNNLGISLEKFIWDEKSGEDLNRTKYAQPAIFVIEFCLYQFWTEMGIRPDIVLGHSIGEFAASVAAGLLSFEDGMKLVCCRSILIDGLPEGRMIAIGASYEKVNDLVAQFHREISYEWIDLACENSREQTVLSMAAETAEKFKIFLDSQHSPVVKSKVLPSLHAFHSRSMDPILEQFAKIASEVEVRDPTCKYISGLLHRELNKTDLTASYWQNHCRNPVSFSTGIDLLLSKGCKVFLEVSPQPILLNFLMANNINGTDLVTCQSLRPNQDTWTTLLGSLAKFYVFTPSLINFKNLPGYSDARISLPLYQFNRKKCWATRPVKGSGVLGQGHGTQFHSLLGWKLNLAMSSELRFYNFISSASTGYVHDHVIVDHIIVPAACYVEMLLTIAHKCFGVKYPVIENFSVLRACVLEDRPKQIQTKVEYDGGNLNVVFCSESDDGEWLLHVQATLNLESPPAMPPKRLQASEIEKIHEECSQEINVDDMYERLDTSGISMGPLFRSARKLCINPDLTTMLGSIKSVKSAEGEFSLHPITIDALVQCFWEYKMCRLDHIPFALPVGINKFVWYGVDNTHLPEDLYFYIRDENRGAIFSAEGDILVEIEVLTVLHSTPMAFLRSITPGEKLPQFITKDWVPLPGASRMLPISGEPENVIDDPNLGILITDDELSQTQSLISVYRQEQMEIEKSYERLTLLYLLKTLRQLDWNPTKSETFRVDSIVCAVSSQSLDARIYIKFLEILTAAGFLCRNGSDEWSVVKDLPQIDILSAEIQKIEQESHNFQHISQAGDALLPILQGQVDPLDILSSKLTSTKSLESHRTQFDSKLLSFVFEPVVKRLWAAEKTLRILQIGALPSTTTVLVEILNRLEIPFDLTVTDVGVNLKKHENLTNNNVTLKALQIQNDPKGQGFQPGAYDMVVAIQVLHMSEDLKGTLENVRHLLTPGGYLFLGELFKEYPDFALSYALLKTYWKLIDSRGFITANPTTWKDLLDQTGFTSTVTFTFPECHRGLFVARATSEARLYRPFRPTLSESDPAWLIFSTERTADLQKLLGNHLKSAGRNVFYVTEGQRFDKLNDFFSVNPKRASDYQQLSHVLKNYEIEGILYFWGITADQTELRTTAELKKCQEFITTGFLNVLKIRINNSWASKVFLVTSGAEEANPAQGTLWGMLDTFFNEYPEATGMGIDLDNIQGEPSASFIFSLLWNTPYERGLRVQNGSAQLARLHAFDSALPLDEILLPKTTHFKLTDPTTLTFGPVETERENVVPFEILVRAVGLNFRDILLCNGLLETPYKDSVGLEFAGVVTQAGDANRFKVGDRVAGLTCAGAFASHVTTVNPQLLFPISDATSFAGAATLPCAYGTCYLSLVQIAKVQPGQKVLIHTASGGVGLAGIQLARYLGADIFVTAGTPKKRTYLKECLGLTHIYNSRTFEFKDQILNDTNGTGVDVIINTITGPGFKEASLACLAQGGTFIELSKLNIWTELEVAEKRPDVVYTILDAFDMIMNSHPSLTSGLNELTDLFARNQMDILPHTKFPLAQLKSAFKYFHAHNHIGKVIVEIPECIEKLSTLTLYNAQSTIMVTGGMGGLGFEVGRYLWSNGANVVLIGRSLPSEEMIEKVSSFGDRMAYVQCDIGDYEKTRELIDKLYPPLRGVFHCAGVFANGFLVGQNAENYAKSFNSKVYGTWNLHLLTKNRHLDHFVIFSSVAAVFGSTGLSNYSAANRYLDSLIHYRVNQCGLPGLTIDWGPWAEVGAAAGYVAGMFKNFHHFVPELGIQSMERAIRLGLNDIAIADMDMNIVQSSPRLGPYLSELSVDTGKGRRNKKSELGMNRPCDIKVANLAKDVLAATDRETRLEKMEIFVETIFRSQSGLSETDVVDKDQALTLMGMDSLIGMEMRLTISKLLDVQISANGVMEHNSIRLFSSYLVGLLSPEQDEASSANVVTPQPTAAQIVISNVQEKVEDRVEISNSDVVVFENSQKPYKPHRSLPKFMAKRLQKFHNSEKKPRNENLQKRKPT